MTDYLFITNPDYEPESVRNRSAQWSSPKHIQPGDRILVYVTGGKGITHKWEAVSEADSDDEWGYMCDVKHVADINPPITLDDIKNIFDRSEWSPPYQNFRGLKHLKLSDKVAEKLGLSVGGANESKQKYSNKDLKDSAVEGEEILSENKRRCRDPELRDARLKQDRYRCQHCGFQKSRLAHEVAGPVLEVHHINPFKDRDTQKSKTHLNDLITLCPTCHRAIHALQEATKSKSAHLDLLKKYYKLGR